MLVRVFAKSSPRMDSGAELSGAEERIVCTAPVEEKTAESVLDGTCSLV